MLRKNLTIFNALLLVGFLGVLTPRFIGAGEQTSRIKKEISENETFALKGNVHPAVAQALAQDQGEVASSQPMPSLSMHFALTSAQQADLDQLLSAQQNRRSAQYHKFLTPEDYATRFGLNTADIQKVTEWLQNKGFSNLHVARSRTWVSFDGTAGVVQSAFRTSIHNYTLRGETHLANASEPQLPVALRGVADHIRGLSKFPIKPRIKVQPRFTSSISGAHFLVPDDWATIYDVQPLYSAGLDGTGVTIAVMGESDVELSDLRAFRSAANLPAKDPTIVVVGNTDPGLQFTSGDEGESDLDLEWAGAIAKNATILFVTANFTTGNGIEDSIAYAIDNNVAPILSTSYGLCEPFATTSDFTVDNALFAQANAQGMTVVGPAGDAGAADCDPPTSTSTEIAATQGLAVDFPASSPYVTGVGGTSFNEGNGSYWNSTNNSYGGSATGYIPEMTWNDGFPCNFCNAGGQGPGASGGGASILVTKPAWQRGTGVPNDGARDVPDLAAATSPTHDPLLICSPIQVGSSVVGSCVNGFRYSDQTLNTTGGTSAAAPTTAGVLALLLQHLGAGSRLGNINPNLYALAAMNDAAPASPQAFHDITQGNNFEPCVAGSPNCPASLQFGYSAGVGYDQNTGLGTLDANNLVEQWSFDYQLSATPSTLTIQPGSSGTAMVTVTPQSNFTGNLTFTCSVASSLPNVTCSVPNSPVNTSGTTTVTITAASNAKTPPVPQSPRNLPPVKPEFIWLLLAAIAVAAGVFMVPKKRSLYAYGTAAFCVLTLFAVSCGSGSSTGTVGTTAPTLILSCSLPATAQIGVAYSGSCTASGGTAPITYSIGSGTLPAGITLNSSTGAITGAATAVGTSSFSVKATDSGSPAQTATLSSPSTITVIAAGETGLVTVTATSGQLINTATVSVTVP